MSEEIWIKVFDNYFVSNLGRVKSTMKKNEKILTPRENGKGYLRVHLSVNGRIKDYYIHRLVADAFIHNPENLPEVNHKDGDKGNNHIDNLEWCTRSENIRHAFDNGLSKSPRAMLGRFGKNHPNSKPIIQYSMDGLFIKEYESISQAVRETGIKSISDCCLGKQRQSGGFVWKYK